MQKLVSAKVLRAGRTARTWNHESDEVKVGTTTSESVRLNFNLNSKGGGVTEVQLEIGAQGFSALASAMVTADRCAAMKVFASSLASEVGKQLEYDREAVRRGRHSVARAAERAYREAPTGKDHAEKLTNDMVDQLVAALDSVDESIPKSESKAA